MEAKQNSRERVSAPERDYSFSAAGETAGTVFAQDVSLDEILRMLWRRKLVIVATVGVMMVAAVGYLATTEPRYSAEARVQIDPARDNIIEIEAVASALSDDATAVLGEVEVIRSRGIADKVISEHSGILLTELLGDPSDGNGAPSSDPEQVADLLGRSANGAASAPTPAVGSAPDTAERLAAIRRSRAIDVFLSKLSVSQLQRSNVVAIEFESQNAVTAATVVNAVADGYIQAQLDKKFESTKLASEWINERLAELEAAVRESERKIEDFRAGVGLIEGVDAPLLTESASRLNAELASAQAQASEAEARLREVQELNGADIDAIAAVISSPAIQNLRDSAAELAQRRAELSTQYGANHPVWVSVNAETAELQARLDEEVARIAESLSSEARVSRAAVETLARRLNQVENEAADASRASVQLRVLERDAEADRNLYELFLARFKETTIQDGIQQADATVVSYADVPTSPSHPKTRLVLAIAFVFSTLLGLTLAFIVERLDLVAFRTAKEMQRILGLPVLGQIPKLTGRAARRLSPEGHVLAEPNSGYAESIRGIRTSMLLRQGETAAGVILVTSGVPGEGKTSTAVALARTFAAGGQRVLAMDCDFRRPRLHKALEDRNDTGLADYLLDESQDLVVHKDRLSNLHYVTAGSEVSGASELLQSARMANLVRGLRDSYDVIVMDSPPVLAVVDPRVLAQLADATVFLVRWGKTRRKVVQAAIELLREAEPAFLGSILNIVDADRMSGYGYGEAGAYYGNKRYAQYYAR